MGLQSRHLNFNSEKIPHYYLCNYRPVSSGLDQLSKSLLNFKCGYPVDTQAWIECALVEIKKISLAPNSIVMRALHSKETSVSATTQLDLLGQRIATSKNAKYEPALLNKVRSTRELKFLSSSDREAELKEAYEFKGGLATKPGVLIIDDILTTGTTMRAIIAAIRKTSEAPITVFTLASTDHQALLNTSVKLTGYNYDWQHSQGWIAAEDMVEYQSQLLALKSKILNDEF